MKPETLWKVFGLTAVLVTVIGISWQWRKEPTPKTQEESSQKNSSTSSEKNLHAKRALVYPWACVPEKTDEFDLTYVSRGQLSASKADQNLQTSLEIGGTLQLTCLSTANNDSSRWSFKMNIQEMTEENTGSFSFSKTVLEEPMEFIWSHKGGVTHFVFPQPERSPSQMVIAEILNHYSFLWLPSPTQTNQWSMTQELHTGKKTFKLTYKNTPQDTSLRKELSPPHATEHYLADYSFTSQGRLQRFVLESKSEENWPGGERLENSSSISLHFKRELPSSPPTSGAIQAPSQSVAKFINDGLYERIYRAELGDLTAEDLKQNLDVLQDSHKITEYFKKYKALFAVEPQSAEIFLDALQDLNPQDDRFQILCLAMVKAGSSHIQNFLLDKIILNDNLTPEKQAMTLSFFGMLENPDPKTVQSVTDLAAKSSNPHLRQSSWLAATNMGRTLKTTHPKTTERVMEKLSEKITRDQTPQDQLESLHALGNLGHARSLTLIENALTLTPVHQQAALLALRFVDPKLSHPLLIPYMNDSADKMVRMSAFEAASFQDLTDEMLQHLISLSSSGKNEELRLAALQLLQQKQEHAPQVIHRALDHASRYDPSLRIRQFAQSLVTTF